MNLLNWLFDPNAGVHYASGVFLCAIAFGLTVRATAQALARGRKALFVTLVMTLIVIVLLALGLFVNKLAAISPIMVLAALNVCALLFVLGIERVRLDNVPVPSKRELESLLSRGLRSVPIVQRYSLTQAQYELAADHIRIEQARLGGPLPEERLHLFASIAKNTPLTSNKGRHHA